MNPDPDANPPERESSANESRASVAHALARPDLPASDERTWAVGAHLASVAGWMGIPMGHILAPLIVWLIKREDSEFVRRQALESLNFQISMTIYSILAAAVAMTIIGLVIAIPALFVLVILDIVLTIVGAVTVSRGEAYRYPFTIRLVS